MNKGLLRANVQEFIFNNLQEDIPALILKGVPFSDVSASEIANQINGINTIQQKAPAMFSKALLYPKKISLEQMSSQETAQYKSSIIPEVDTLLDCTGGFGVDTFFLSTKAKATHYCEINPELFEIAQHNFSVLGRSITCYNKNGLDVLKRLSTVDVVYIDPSRRTKQKKKIISLQDSTPNLLQTWDFLLEQANTILVKLSPMLDLTYLQNSLPGLEQIHIISIKNDVKEVILKAKKGVGIRPEIILADYSQNKWHTWNAETENITINICQSIPETGFIYEPLGVLLKANKQDNYTNNFKMQKLANNSHLYISQQRVQTPFLKCYAYEQLVPFKIKVLKKLLPEGKVNVICKNFPLQPEQVLKKLNKKQGGNTFLICTSSKNKKWCFIAKKCDK